MQDTLTNAVMSIIEQFAGRNAGPVIQFIKYAITGCLGTTFHLIFFNILSWKIFPALQTDDPLVKLLKWQVIEVDNSTRARNSMINNSIMFLFANLLVYFINIYWVFEPGRHRMLIEIGLFYLTSLVSLVIGTGLMGLLIKKYGTNTTNAFFINLVVAVVINYTARKFIIFPG